MKCKFTVGDKVICKDGCPGIIGEIIQSNDGNSYLVEFGYGIDFGYYDEKDLKPYTKNTTKQKEIKNTNVNLGELSDGYHTFNELYEYRKLYNAALFNEWAKNNIYDIHKSKLYSNGEIPFGNPNWFIVMAELPTGQISNHYEMKDWDLFQIPEKEKANNYDGHSPKDVAERIRNFLNPKPKYPTNYGDCCNIVGFDKFKNFMYYSYEPYIMANHMNEYETSMENKLNMLGKLLICRDAYWKIAGEEMGMDRPWEPDYIEESYEQGSPLKYVIYYTGTHITKGQKCTPSYILSFPTEEIRDIFYENFKDLINECKEFL